MKNKITFIVTAIALLFVSYPLMAADMSVEEIVNKANLASYYAGDDGKSVVNMSIKDSQGRERKREFVILRKDKQDGGEQFFYVYFKKPGDVRKMVFLVNKHVNRDDDRWLYLPALDLVKRIAASDKRTSFVGSNFLYEDISGRGLDEDKHELIETTDEFYLIKNTPVSADNVEFSQYTVWIDKKTFLPRKAVYLDKNNKEYRKVEALEIQDIDGIPTVTKSRAVDLLNNSETIMEFSNIKYNIGLDEKIFSERSLRRPPREVRK